MVAKISVKDLRIDFGNINALKGTSIDIEKNEILGIIGPANSGKTSFLRAINRLNDLAAHLKISGTILLDGEDIYRRVDKKEIRRRIGMGFAPPLPPPLSFFL